MKSDRKISSFYSIIYLCASFFTCNLFAQEKIGIVNDNFLPLHQHRLNPSAIVDQKPKVSINLLGFEFFAKSNFLFLPDMQLVSGSNYDNIEFKESANIMKAFVVSEVNLPSFSMVLGNHSLALHSRARSYTYVNNMPTVLGKILADESVDEIMDGQYRVRNASVKSMSWAEIGITYGRIIWKSPRKSMLTAAIGVNRIFGIQQASFFLDNAKVDVVDGEGVLIDVEGDYSFTDPNWKSGMGWSSNFGLTYKRMLNDIQGYIPHSALSDCKRMDYLYKIGFSILDFGKVNFNKSAYYSPFDETVEISELEEEVMEEDVRKEAGKISGNKYAANLPTALSLQVDYNLGSGFFLNASLVQNIGNTENFGVEKANFLALSPRFEKRRIGFAVPFSLMDYTEPQIGFVLRLGPLSIGTEHIIPLLKKSDVYGADIYFNLNIQIFNSSICKSGKKKKNKVDET